MRQLIEYVGNADSSSSGIGLLSNFQLINSLGLLKQGNIMMPLLGLGGTVK